MMARYSSVRIQYDEAYDVWTKKVVDSIYNRVPENSMSTLVANVLSDAYNENLARNSQVESIYLTVLEMIHAGSLSADGEGSSIYNIRKAEKASSEEVRKAHAAKDSAIEAAKAANTRAIAAMNDAKLAREEAKNASTILEVHVLRPEQDTVKFDGVFHKQFKKICDLANARCNIFLYGPTGCGKSHVCEQLANVLGLEFSFVSCTAGMSENVLGGRLLPTGKQGTFEYVISEFIRAYEHGGVFLLDEIDAADPNVLLVVNAALASGKVAVPNRPNKPYAVRHPDFICIAAANTFGTGADRMYSGRNKLDTATLDRFQIGKVIMAYDETIEAKLCPDDELRGRLLRYRKAVFEHRLERAISTRFLRDAYKMTHPAEFGMSFDPWTDEEVDAALFSGWREDEVHKTVQFAKQCN